MKWILLLLLIPTVTALTSVTISSTINIVADNQTINLTSKGSVLQVINLSNIINTSFVFESNKEVNTTLFVQNITVNQIENVTIKNQTLEVTACSEEEFNTKVSKEIGSIRDRVDDVHNSCLDELGGLTNQIESQSSELSECKISLANQESENKLNSTVCGFNQESLEKDVKNLESNLSYSKDTEYWLLGFFLLICALFGAYVVIKEGTWGRGKYG